MIIDRIFAAVDVDGDGVIAADEMAEMQDRRRTFVKSADADGDGKVTRAEVLKVMQERLTGGRR